MNQVAVIQFPGSNCEYETLRAVESVGLTGMVFRWNRSARELADYRAFILPGGFSYQDRIRAGAVAAKDSIMAEIARRADEGRPVLGICNGAQILVESGLVPGTNPGQVQMALATNRMTDREGYFCNWSRLAAAADPELSLWTRFWKRGDVTTAPIAHAEGRFTSADEEVRRMLREGDRVAFRYVGPDGSSPSAFPHNPNGSIGDVAGITNPAGNVLAMMPHPERANWLRQVPAALPGTWGEKRKLAGGDFQAMESPGPMRPLFSALKKFLDAED
ncbi:phosphoribosylformylglycinamidine synthase I [candidate division KSB1 bacterium]